MDSFDQRMDVLRARFVKRALAEREELRAALAGGDHDTAKRILHALAGNAGLFGYPALGSSAYDLENALDQGAGEHDLRQITQKLMHEFPSESRA